MKKLLLLLLFNINLLLIPLTSKAFVDFSTGLEYGYFNKQNQLLTSYNLIEVLHYINSGYFSLLNVSLGLRTFYDKKPDVIYKLFLLKSKTLIPIVETDTSEALKPGDGPRSFWNYLKKWTILNYDRTQIENSLMQWLQFGIGYGFNNSEINEKDKFNLDGFVFAKLGISTLKLGENNFKNIDNNSTERSGLETGLNLFFDLVYKQKMFLKTEFDYSLFQVDKLRISINKLNIGFFLGYNYFFTLDYNFGGRYRDYIKFSLGANYYKYYLDSSIKDFIKYEFTFNYFFYNQYKFYYAFE